MTNQLHGNVKLDAFQSFILGRLDGSRDVERLAEDHRAALAQEEVAPPQAGHRIGEFAPEPRLEIIRDVLFRIQKYGLLVG